MTSLDLDDVTLNMQYKCTEVGDAKGEQIKFLVKPNNFGYQNIPHVLRKCVSILDVSFTNKKVIGV